MTNTRMCPFTKGPCTECPLYRGRHYYLPFSKHSRNVTGAGKFKNKDNPDNNLENYKCEVPDDIPDTGIRHVEESVSDR